MTSLVNKDIIRRCLFRPYCKGAGPVFTLVMWDTHHAYHGGPQWCIGYRFTMREPHNNPVVVFEAEDYGCSPLHAIDSDDCVNGLMNFLTLRPGDTDREYFDEYTPEQMDYCQSHAEALSAEVMARYGER